MRFSFVKFLNMIKTTTAPSTRLEYEVRMTRDYTRFKTIEGNRKIKNLHRKRLLQSMKENYLFTVIIINEDYEIIDGQHRFSCIKELGLPLYYIMCRGYGVNEVHVLNENTSNWNAEDYADGYCDFGMEDYVTYREFRNKYGFNHTIALSLLTNNPREKHTESFKGGKFKVNNYKRACTNAEKLISIKPYYDGFLNREFVATILQLLQNKNFDFEFFMSKLKSQPNSLKDCRTIDDYKLLIEDIYNFRTRNKVNLRY